MSASRWVWLDRMRRGNRRRLERGRWTAGQIAVIEEVARRGAERLAELFD